MKYQKLFAAILVLGLLSPVTIIALDLFEIVSSSENDMTAASFVYISLIFFGLAGLLLSKRFLKKYSKAFSCQFSLRTFKFLSFDTFLRNNLANALKSRLADMS